MSVAIADRAMKVGDRQTDRAFIKASTFYVINVVWKLKTAKRSCEVNSTKVQVCVPLERRYYWSLSILRLLDITCLVTCSGIYRQFAIIRLLEF